MTKKTRVEEVGIVPAVPPKRELILEGDPEAQLAFASKAANALMSIVTKKPNPVIIRGKQFLEYGDWQVLGRFYGATVEIEWTKPIEQNGKLVGYEARALVKRQGEIISSAEGMCTRDEQRWKTADEYAVRSMAQTRTAAKALRNAFGWVAELAGYSATPAEEMPVEPKMAPYKVSRVVPPSDDEAGGAVIRDNQFMDPITTAEIEKDDMEVAYQTVREQIKSILMELGNDISTKAKYIEAIKKYTPLPPTLENYSKILAVLRDQSPLENALK